MAKNGGYLGGSTLVPQHWLGTSERPTKTEQAEITRENEEVARRRGKLIGPAALAQKRRADKRRKRAAAESERRRIEAQQKPAPGG